MSIKDRIEAQRNAETEERRKQLEIEETQARIQGRIHAEKEAKKHAALQEQETRLRNIADSIGVPQILQEAAEVLKGRVGNWLERSKSQDDVVERLWYQLRWDLYPSNGSEAGSEAYSYIKIAVDWNSDVTFLWHKKYDSGLFGSGKRKEVSQSRVIGGEEWHVNPQVLEDALFTAIQNPLHFNRPWKSPSNW